MTVINWNDVLDSILPNEDVELNISNPFVQPLLVALDFNVQEQCQQFKTGKGGEELFPLL
jgi:hypothetical protein